VWERENSVTLSKFVCISNGAEIVNVRTRKVDIIASLQQSKEAAQAVAIAPPRREASTVATAQNTD
jgi:hypothetical protein